MSEPPGAASPAFNLSRWYPGSLLPKEDGASSSLVLVVTILAFLACLAGMGALAAGRAADGWRGQLENSATVVVRPTGLETPDSAAARAAQALAGVRGVAEVKALEPAKAEALVAPWFGPEGLPPGLPVPRLVAVDLDPAAPATPAAMGAALKAAGIDATVDDHTIWMADIKRAGLAARAFALGLFLLIAIACGSVIVFATSQGLTGRRDLIEVLHIAGATDEFIARLFQARFARVAARGGIYGGVLAIALGASFKLYGGTGGLASMLPLAWTDLAVVAPCPVIAALIAAVTARVAAMAQLGAQP